ncbi:DUF6880 family protein [Telmatospirillum sp.]|uniref:DUF6880 family protein n=1 Tax=Telmatospirillum sp. TaxID=2079197 RepID=UPI00283F806F|nr:DUF6880 family protein [Telmatospirillum sp.]MDR3439682.1 hypothetical protein [Telmatospirillum sp.]
MARKSAASLDALILLGAEKLAQVILDEAETNPSFRKRVTAALVSTKGPDAVAKLIDRRLAALERARAMVAWEKERAFAEDLGATVETITKELGPLSPVHAVQRLLRFVDSHGSVFDRIDDSNGRIQDVYWQASEAIPDFVGKLPPEELARLPERLQVSLGKDTHGLAPRIGIAVAPLLPETVLAAWDAMLQKHDDAAGFVEIRQAIADARGDLDEFLALEVRRPEWRQEPLKAAERLLAANRLDEALLWVRREKKGGVAFATESDIADGRINRVHDLERVRLEARILEAMKDRPAAQALRWAAFEATLDADILRDYIRKLDDFIEDEEQDRAFAVAAASPHPYTALAFFIAWPRLDLASKLVLEKREFWDGRHYGALGDSAAALEEDFPLAATVLYRVLLNAILARAKSPAYGHGARYLAKLGELGERIPEDSGLENHATYFLGLKKAHGRKVGFWSIVDGKNRA